MYVFPSHYETSIYIYNILHYNLFYILFIFIGG